MSASRRFREGVAKVERNREYTLDQAIETLIEFPKARFDETVEMSFSLGIDPKKSDQAVRGTVAFPTAPGGRSGVC